jgi:hypothetical protein
VTEPITVRVEPYDEGQPALKLVIRQGIPFTAHTVTIDVGGTDDLADQLEAAARAIREQVPMAEVAS